ncbi:MAG: TolC family protein [Betaproteobacteria bacterium]
MISMAGCALRTYRPAPLEPSASASAYESRTIDAAPVREYLGAHDVDVREWPLRSWDLAALTLVAFYYHPDLEVARAQARAARADTAVATQHPPLGVQPALEHHTARTEQSSSPWSAGFEIDIPIGGGSSGKAIREQYDALAEAAALRVGSVAWEVRSRLRSRYLDYYASLRDSVLLDAEVQDRAALVRLLQRRLEAGAISSTEASVAQLGLADAQNRQRVAQSSRERDLAALAQALAVPLRAVRALSLDFSAFDQIAPAPSDTQAQRAALLNRLDVRTKLQEYAAAEADVKLQIARQYPSITLKPSYLWDQGDNVWSLAVGLILAPTRGNAPAIDAAQARRDVAASEFRRLQSNTIALAEGALAVFAKRAEGLADNHRSLADQQVQRERIEKQFAAGYADRVDIVQAALALSLASRTVLAARVDALRAQGELEDALQIPLAGTPFPLLTAAPAPNERAPSLTQQ